MSVKWRWKCSDHHHSSKQQTRFTSTVLIESTEDHLLVCSNSYSDSSNGWWFVLLSPLVIEYRWIVHRLSKNNRKQETKQRSNVDECLTLHIPMCNFFLFLPFSFTWGAHYLRWLLTTSVRVCCFERMKNTWDEEEKMKWRRTEKRKEGWVGVGKLWVYIRQEKTLHSNRYSPIKKAIRDVFNTTTDSEQQLIIQLSCQLLWICRRVSFDSSVEFSRLES